MTMALGKEVAKRPLTKRIFNPIQIIDYTHLLVIYDRVILAIAENRPRLRLPLAPTYDGKKGATGFYFRRLISIL